MRRLAPFLLLTLQLGSARLAMAEDPLVFTAALAPAHATAVYAYQSGVVTRVAFQEGDSVTVGNILAWLDDAEWRFAEESARLAYQKSQTQLARAEPLHTQGGLATQTLESLRYETEQARLRWQRAELELKRATIRAPVAGLLAERRIHPGELTSPRLCLFVIIDPTDLQTELQIPVDRLLAVQLHQSATAIPLADSSQIVTGRLIYLSPIVNPESGTCRAVALFPKAGRTIKSGTVARVRLNQE